MSNLQAIASSTGASRAANARDANLYLETSCGQRNFRRRHGTGLLFLWANRAKDFRLASELLSVGIYAACALWANW